LDRVVLLFTLIAVAGDSAAGNAVRRAVAGAAWKE